MELEEGTGMEVALRLMMEGLVVGERGELEPEETAAEPMPTVVEPVVVINVEEGKRWFCGIQRL